MSSPCPRHVVENSPARIKIPAPATLQTGSSWTWDLIKKGSTKVLWFSSPQHGFNKNSLWFLLPHHMWSHERASHVSLGPELWAQCHHRMAPNELYLPHDAQTTLSGRPCTEPGVARTHSQLVSLQWLWTWIWWWWWFRLGLYLHALFSIARRPFALLHFGNCQTTAYWHFGGCHTPTNYWQERR